MEKDLGSQLITLFKYPQTVIGRAFCLIYFPFQRGLLLNILLVAAPFDTKHHGDFYLYISNMKDEQEWLIVNKFKECYKDFPKGDLTKDEQPDFRVVDGSKTVGIEVAEVFQDAHHHNHSHLKQDESVQNKFEKTLLEGTQQHTDKHFILGVTLSQERTIATNKLKELTKACLPSCLEFIWNNEIGSHIHLDNYHYFLHHLLPDEVESIYIMLLPDHIPSFNDQSQGGVVSNLQYKHIEPTLRRHTEALSKYKKCDEYWLLIREGNYYAGSFAEVNISVPIDTKFHRVFLIRTNTSEIIRLK